jgi:hypothetical protein
MSVKVAIAIAALALYELSHECRSKQFLASQELAAVPFINYS